MQPRSFKSPASSAPLIPFCLGLLSATVVFLIYTSKKHEHTGIANDELSARASTPQAASEAQTVPSVWPDRGVDLAAQSLQYPASNSIARKKVLAVIGVQTGFTTNPNPKYNYENRRRAVRETWFPKTREAMHRLESDQGLVVRFVVGHSKDAAQEAALAQEAAAFGGFWRLPMQEAYLDLANKTLLFLRDAVARYDAQYIIKVDDDVYFRLDRAPHAVRQWQDVNADYVGCMKTGVVIKSPRQRWYEPQHAVLGGANSQYFTHAWGPVYVVSGRVAEHLAAMPAGSLRFFNNEDVTVGGWMLAFNVTHLDDRRLCSPSCSPSSLAVYDIPVCAGLCDPSRQLPLLHASPSCRDPTLAPTGALPPVPSLFYFDKRPDPGWEAAAVAALKSKRAKQAAALGAQQAR